ncbi:hypothetical protein [Lacisediminimonas sp.]|uniref:hypothetical protein n=1 Tax=Lacisediminimonas sp. TaxID=3060582 RepID=UPI0027170C13|nr:hypothetical protein [Lacisediminimonas sp.]MDO8299201.1 hypothetical protein [Lacisediminimonas sp.]
MKFNFNQVAIAFGLFLLGYLTFNNPWFSGSKEPAAAAKPPAAAAPGPASTPTTPAASPNAR